MYIYRRQVLPMFSAALAAAPQVARAEKRYGPGASDREIKLGQSMPYSGPLSAVAGAAKAMVAYFEMLNAGGGINGRRVRVISLDDGYSPPKAVEMTRKLVEDDQVLAIFGNIGTATNVAIQKYLNAKKVPQLFLASGASRWADPRRYPWTMGWQPNYHTEAIIYARYVLANVKEPRIGLLYQNDDFGKDYVAGFMAGLGGRGNVVAGRQSYEMTDPTIDSQIFALKAAGANVLFLAATAKFTALAIRKASDIDWKPLRLISNVAASIGAVLAPAGLATSTGIVTTQFLKDANDTAWRDDIGMRTYLDFLAKWMPGANASDTAYAYGYSIAGTMAQVLKQCGDDLTRENIMRQAAGLRGLALPMLLPGIEINTSPDRWTPISQEQLVRFDGKSWVRFGEIVNGAP